MKKLGFDLGSNSIGWALVNEKDEKILGMGSVVFPMGVNLEKGTKEVSKNATRREKRQSRRQNFRRKMRKEILVKELMANGMFPDINDLHKKYFPGNQNKSFRQKWQDLIRQVVLCEELRSFFMPDPYTLRHKAFEGAKLSLFELGRVLYHFAQRRGYRETLQDQDEGKIYEGKPEEGKIGINQTKEGVESFKTLGNYLYFQNPHEERRRNRYTLRSMYQDEFDLIWKEQSQFYLDILTTDLYEKLGGRHKSKTDKNGILFYQRPLRSSKHLLGNCSFETDKSVSPLSTLDFEEYRAFQNANNIKFENRPLNDEERSIVTELLLSSDKKVDFKKITGKLGKKAESKLFNFKEEDKFPGSPTTANFRKIFKDKWNKFSQKEQEDIWHVKYTAEDPEWLDNYLLKFELSDKDKSKFKAFKLADGYSNLSRKATRKIIEFLKKGYQYDEAVLLAGAKAAMNSKFERLSEKEISFFEDNVISAAKNGEKGKSTTRIENFLRDEYAIDEKGLKKLYHHSVRETGDGSLSFLPEPENVKNPIVMKALYELRKLYNAIVKEYGKPDQVNIELARDLKASKSERDKIRKQQQERETENDEIKAKLDEFDLPHTVENITKLKLFKEIEVSDGVAVNPFNPEETFSLSQLFSNDGYIQIEHIIPYSISLNNSLANKTLCDADTNRLKGNKTPFQYFEKTGGDWESLKSRIFKILPYHKAKRFISERNPDADSFIERQLNDTRYISKVSAQYLQQACKKVDVIQGGATSLLRYFWGLDGILGETYPLELPDGEYQAAIDKEGNVTEARAWSFKSGKKDADALAKKGKLVRGNVKDEILYPIKERDDHRHHAIDALVAATAKKGYLQKLSTLLGEGYERKNIKYRKENQLERPWENFWMDAKVATDSVLVYHDKRDRVVSKVKKKLFLPNGSPFTIDGKQIYGMGMSARGELHKETVYGEHLDEYGNKKYHVRKPIDTIQNDKHLKKVVSQRVREAIENRIKELYPAEKLENGDLPNGWKLTDLSTEDKKNVYFTTNEQNQRIPQIYLKNKNGDPIPVRKVRMRETIGNAVKLKEGVNQFVNPQNNYMTIIYEDHDGKWTDEVISLWSAVEKKVQGLQIDKLNQAERIIAKLQINDLFIIGLTDDQFEEMKSDSATLCDYLYRVQKLSLGDYSFRHHVATSLTNPNEELRIASFKKWKTLNPIKVQLLRLGRIEKC
ncbi:type II CRISPR RNA-guided endonuclease Cas9 [Halocola ammonii]